jgi:hypothetical protein
MKLPIEGEAMGALAHRDHQHRRRSIDGVARGHLAAAGLQIVGRGRRRRAVVAQHRENGADGNVHVGVRGAVERIEDQQIAAARVLFRHGVGLIQFFGGHAGDQAAPFAAADHHVVRQHIELLLRFALHVLGADIAQVTAQRPFGRHRRDRLDRRRHVHQQRTQVGGALDAVQLLDQEFRERGASQVHGQTPSGLGLLASS